MLKGSVAEPATRRVSHDDCAAPPERSGGRSGASARLRAATPGTHPDEWPWLQTAPVSVSHRTTATLDPRVAFTRLEGHLFSLNLLLLVGPYLHKNGTVVIRVTLDTNFQVRTKIRRHAIVQRICSVVLLVECSLKNTETWRQGFLWMHKQ